MIVIADRAGGHDNHFNLLRMLAAGGVMVSHAFPLALGPGAPEPLAFLPGLNLGTVCVFVFFAISGFYITRSFDRSGDTWSFLVARVLRLWPALVVMLTLTLALAAVLTTAPLPEFAVSAAKYFVKNVTMLKEQYGIAGVFTDLPYPEVINGPLWSLYYEVCCYAIVLTAGIAGVFTRSFWAKITTVCLIVVCLALPKPAVLVAFVGLPFAYGAAFYLWRDRVPLGAAAYLIVLAMGAAAWILSDTVAFLPVFQLALTYGILALGFAKGTPCLAYNRLGDYSYGFYIYAFPMQQIAVMNGAVTPAQVLAFAGPTTLCCAVLSWHLVERPAQGLRGMFTRQHSPGELA